MKCPKCGKELKPDEMFCENCGALILSANKGNQTQDVAVQKATNPDAKMKKTKKSPKQKKNLALKIVAIVLAIAVFITGGIFIFDTVSYRNSVEGAEFIKDFPVLKLKTKFKVYDGNKFPVEEYNIKIEKYKGGHILKSEMFADLETVVEETSKSTVYTIDFPENGNYRITLTDITASRIQPLAIVVEVEVDNEDPNAVDTVDLNSKEEKGFEKKDKSYVETIEPVITATADENDFDKFEETLNTILPWMSDPTYDYQTTDITYVLDSMWKFGGAYRYYFDEPEYEGNYEKMPEENVRWICENIYNIEYGTVFEPIDYAYYYENGYFYIGSYDVGGNEYDEYEVAEYTLAGDKYEIIVDTFRHSYETTDIVFVEKLKVTASLKVIDGEEYWSFYKIEKYAQNGNKPEIPTEPPTQATEPTETPTQPSTQTPTQPSSPSSTVPLNANVKVGDYVKFGKYEQDANTSNGKEDIEWLVLDVQDGKALVISKYALDAKPYNEEYGDVTWETCTLRTWLNNEFYNTAFSNSEKNKISTTNVVAEDNPSYGTEAGNNTQDKVFLLSISEAETYFSSDDERCCKPTQYAIDNGAWYYDEPSSSYDGNCWWWLRSPGNDQLNASDVYSGGSVFINGGHVDNSYYAFRPVLWVNL